MGVGGGEEEPSDAPAPESQAWARSAASRVSQVLGASESETPLTAVIARQPSADELVDELSAIGGLPVATTTPVRALVVARVAPKGLRLAGALAAAGLGPVALADLGAGWAALQLEDAPERSDLLADFVGETLLGRGDRGWGKRVLVLWRDAIGAAGFRVYRGSSMVEDGEWGTGWEHPDADHWSVRDAAADRLRVLAPRGAADVARLRSLLRSTTWEGDPLAELLAALGMPESTLAMLDGEAGAPPAQRLEPAGRREILRGVLTGVGWPPLAPRWALLVYMCVAVFAAIVLAVLAALSIAVIITDGGILDESSFDSEPWIVLGLCLVGIGLNGLAAMGAARQARHAAAEDLPADSDHDGPR